MNKIMLKIIFIILATIAFSTKANSTFTEFAKCKTIIDDQARLTCYDAVTISQNTSIDKSLSKSEIVKELKQQEFGLKNIEENPDNITSVVTKVNKTAYGKLIVYLESGHAWRQIDSTKYKVKKGETVSIRKAALNSFLLSKASTKRSIRVKRIK